MGSSKWSDSHYADRVALRSKTGSSTFAYSDDIKTGKKESKVHEKLNPLTAKMRESCDSETHPNTTAVAVLFDVTGSMQKVPQIMQKKLPQLMGLLLRKSYLESPHILIGGIGDATCDTAPLQVGQFEAGIEIENDLTNIYLEGGGGGSNNESYELALYFIAKHTKIDCFDKRKKKGYLFIIGDELPYSSINVKQVESVIGDKIQGNIPVEKVIEELEERYEIYFIIPNMTSHYNDASLFEHWKGLLGQRVLKLDDPAGIAELIASTIGMNEGKVDHDGIEDDLTDIGLSKSLVRSVSSSLATVENKLDKKAKGTDIVVSGSGAGSGVTVL